MSREIPESDRGFDPTARGPSVLQLVNLLLRDRHTIAAVTLAVMFVVVVLSWIGARAYTASASFMPQNPPSSQGRLASLADQFGMQIPTGETGRSPKFYADLLQSREILGQVIAEPFLLTAEDSPDAAVAREGHLAALLGLADEEPAPRRRAAAIRWLQRDAISVSTDAETGVVRLEVTTPDPELSGRIAERLIEAVHQFNLETRQSQAAAERSFVQERVEEARGSLAAAEDHLKQFLENNRTFGNSPELRFEHDRLQREVAVQQQLFTSLVEAFEQARIAEVRNTPVITVIESPEVPLRPDPRMLPLRAALGLILGGALGCMVALGREYLRRSRAEGHQDVEEFDRLRAEMRQELRGLGSRFRGGRPPDGSTVPNRR